MVLLEILPCCARRLSAVLKSGSWIVSAAVAIKHALDSDKRGLLIVFFPPFGKLTTFILSRFSVCSSFI